MKLILTEIIKRIHQRKKAAKIWPDYVTLIEIRIEILLMTEAELSKLVKDGKLSTGPTGNSEYYKLNDGNI